MFSIDWSKALSFVESGAAMVKEFAPLAALEGPAGVVAAGLITKVADVVDSVATTAQEAADVVGSDNLAKIQAAAAETQAENVKLNQSIDGTA